MSLSKHFIGQVAEYRGSYTPFVLSYVHDCIAMGKPPYIISAYSLLHVCRGERGQTVDSQRQRDPQVLLEVHPHFHCEHAAVDSCS